MNRTPGCIKGIENCLDQCCGCYEDDLEKTLKLYRHPTLPRNYDLWIAIGVVYLFVFVAGCVLLR